ncbi:MAG: hypothetical protein JXA82_19200 [Sedimentisphaerales bacterium]|nr:hypothetical protein [Sedimentisphaerales bacterium]
MEVWDYLIVTASNEQQADSYRGQLNLRLKLGFLSQARHVMVIADPEGRRIGSGGSTLYCLLQILKAHGFKSNPIDREQWSQILRRLRILIIHAGGDSKRLPAYGPCGKLFLPVPGQGDGCLPTSLFDRQLPTYLALPPLEQGQGQIVVTTGDVLLRFNPEEVHFREGGITGLGCLSDPIQASHHGVFVPSENGYVHRFLQKPSKQEQKKWEAMNAFGQSTLDLGVLCFDANVIIRLLDLFTEQTRKGDSPSFVGELGRAVMEYGLDIYRELCCALGTRTTLQEYIKAVHSSGSRWEPILLEAIFRACRSIPFHVNTLSRCDFLHFGTSQEVVGSGYSLLRFDTGPLGYDTCLEINNEISSAATIGGHYSWVEGCRINSDLVLEGQNLVVGATIDRPVTLPKGACLDCIAGVNRQGEKVHFVRVYGITDQFKDTLQEGATFCNLPLSEWIEKAGVDPGQIWDNANCLDKRTLWDAMLFPVVYRAVECADWLWMFSPDRADAEQLSTWKNADRYSMEEMALLVRHEDFYRRRYICRASRMQSSLRTLFHRHSRFSAKELEHVLWTVSDPLAWIVSLISEMRWFFDSGSSGIDSLVFPRVIHTLAGAMEGRFRDGEAEGQGILKKLYERLGERDQQWLTSIKLAMDNGDLQDWCDRARMISFRSFERTIIQSRQDRGPHPTSVLRCDEIVWARAPARFDTGGGWTDTPPYSLERGGQVVNVAVNLNGQPPIQAYGRVIREPVIRITSIDLGTRIEVDTLDGLMDYRHPESEFALAKAAIALSGFSLEVADWSGANTLSEILDRFGGGIELTTLAAIPKGSGLGTSSIMGAVLVALLQRMMGRQLTQRELFHAVLRLEQALTTGGGWQDQIGGVVAGCKISSTQPGLTPDPMIHFLPADVIDPARNGGRTLLYYTGITRLAKNILAQVVGRYLDRDRHALFTLSQIQSTAVEVANAISKKDHERFGRLIDTVWRYNIELDPNSTNPQIDAILQRIHSHIWGAKLLGAGGGGFLLMVCRSPGDVLKVRNILLAEPPNERARFFDYDINTEGLVVTVC